MRAVNCPRVKMPLAAGSIDGCFDGIAAVFSAFFLAAASSRGLVLLFLFVILKHLLFALIYMQWRCVSLSSLLEEI